MSRYRIPGTDDGHIIFAVCFVIALGLGFIGLPLFVWETAIQASKNLTAMNEAFSNGGGL